MIGLFTSVVDSVERTLEPRAPSTLFSRRSFEPNLWHTQAIHDRFREACAILSRPDLSLDNLVYVLNKLTPSELLQHPRLKPHLALLKQLLMYRRRSRTRVHPLPFPFSIPEDIWPRILDLKFVLHGLFEAIAPIDFHTPRFRPSDFTSSRQFEENFEDNASKNAAAMSDTSRVREGFTFARVLAHAIEDSLVLRMNPSLRELVQSSGVQKEFEHVFSQKSLLQFPNIGLARREMWLLPVRHGG